MKVIYFFFLYLLFSASFIDALPMHMLYRGKKAESAKTSSPTLKKSPSFSSDEPNIPSTAPAHAQLHPATLDNLKLHSAKVQASLKSSLEKDPFKWKGEQTDEFIASNRKQIYAKHNEVQLNMTPIGGKFALSRSESGRNDVYYAIRNDAPHVSSSTAHH